MTIYIFTITYNFDTDYVVRKYGSREEATKALNEFLEEEVQIIRTECEYEPSVLKWEEDDITLVYEEGYTEDDKEYALEQCAYYRVFQVEI